MEVWRARKNRLLRAPVIFTPRDLTQHTLSLSLAPPTQAGVSSRLMLPPKRPYLPAPQVEVGTANGCVRRGCGESAVSWGARRVGAQLRLQPRERVVDAVQLAVQHGDLFHSALLLLIQQLLRLVLVALKVALAEPVPVPRKPGRLGKCAQVGLRWAQQRREGRT